MRAIGITATFQQRSIDAVGEAIGERKGSKDKGAIALPVLSQEAIGETMVEGRAFPVQSQEVWVEAVIERRFSKREAAPTVREKIKRSECYL
ncbi:MAG: hypothetical protein KME15_15505 [Drouetiella hepatica Uher 2000/2452]|jgi:hypothetical protein|uniref:Uncharacterized protein n=1 Tax=Drouetiella hepatica Uher 2000/2452 TaxID=904376 RepID=A0A951UMU8_9CYAN|nr:hypothetical protein [Drouetiella hepatica Uher 2000/2452]